MISEQNKILKKVIIKLIYKIFPLLFLIEIFYYYK